MALAATAMEDSNILWTQLHLSLSTRFK